MIELEKIQQELNNMRGTTEEAYPNVERQNSGPGLNSPIMQLKVSVEEQIKSVESDSDEGDDLPAEDEGTGSV